MLKAPCHAAVVRSAAVVSAPPAPTTSSMASGAAVPRTSTTTTFRAALAHVPRPMDRVRFDRVRPVANQGKGMVDGHRRGGRVSGEHQTRVEEAHTAALRSAGLAAMTTAAVMAVMAVAAVVGGPGEVLRVDEAELDEAAGVYSQGHKERPYLPRAKLDIGGDERLVDGHLRLTVGLLVIVFPFRRALSTFLFQRRLVGHILHEVVVELLRVVLHRHQLHVCADGFSEIRVGFIVAERNPLVFHQLLPELLRHKALLREVARAQLQ